MIRAQDIVIQAIQILLDRQDPATLTEAERAIVRSSDLRIVLSKLEVIYNGFLLNERDVAVHADPVARRRQLEGCTTSELLNHGTRIKSAGHVVRPWDAGDLQVICEILHVRGDDSCLAYFGLVKSYPDYAGYMD